MTRELLPASVVRAMFAPFVIISPRVGDFVVIGRGSVGKLGPERTLIRAVGER